MGEKLVKEYLKDILLIISELEQLKKMRKAARDLTRVYSLKEQVNGIF